MIVCIIMIFLSALFTYIAVKYRNKYNETNNKNYKYIYIILAFLAFLIPFLISGFRAYTVGTDTSGTYLNLYNLAKDINIYKNVRDIGYAIINRLVYLLFNNYTVVLLITSGIICGCSFYRIFKTSDKPTLSTYLFFVTNMYFISMNMIRESIAISIFILFMPLLMEKNWKAFFIFLFGMLIGFSIHPTAFVYVLLYVLFNFIEINRKRIIIFTVFNAIFGKVVVKIFLQICEKISYFNTYFSWYLKSNYNTGKFSLFSFLTIFSILVVLVVSYKYIKNDKKCVLLLWLTTIATNILLYSPYLPLMQRTSWLFSLPIFILIPSIFKNLEKEDERKSKIIKFMLIGGYTLYMICTIFIMGYHDIVPYKSIFNI